MLSFITGVVRMRVRALTFRILNQLRHDKRTLALMFFAPMMVLTLLYFILGNSTYTPTVAVINAPLNYVNNLEDNNIMVVRYNPSDAAAALEQGKVIATLDMVNGKSYIELDASNPGKAKAVLAALDMAKMKAANARPDLMSEVKYVYGYEDITMFDNFGSVLIGFMIFFFVFLIAGISFLQERTTGTLEKLLSTPIQRWEIVAGYVFGFGIITILQSIFISGYCIYVLKVMMIGSFGWVLTITTLAAMTALTLGCLVSTAANNEFQMIQFIPVIIIPQIFFSGLFDLTPWLNYLGYVMPLHYIANALTQVMIKGHGFSAISGDIAVLLGFSTAFMIINTRLLRKYRRI